MANKKQPQSKPKKAKSKPPKTTVVYQRAPEPAAKPSPTIAGVGSDIGYLLGSGLSKIFGLGAYKISQNTVYNDLMKNQVPVMHSSSESVVFRHREYIADVSSTASFTTTVYSVNPGLALTFPYLSNIAQNFQEYEFRGLVFEFKSTSATALNSTNTALGTVIMAAQYRADATAFVDKQQMLNEMWSADSKPSDSFILPIECAPAENPLHAQYVRGSSVPTGQDTKMYDLCKLTVGTYGSQATAVVGELWATYEVVLRKPQLSSGLNLYGKSAHYSSQSFTNSAPLGGAAVQSGDTIGLVFTNTTITWPLGSQGYFLVTLVWIGTSASIVGPALSYTNCTSSKLNNFASLSNFSTTSSVAMYEFVVNIADPTLVATVTLGGAGTLPSSGTNGVFVVTQLAYLTYG